MISGLYVGSSIHSKHYEMDFLSSIFWDPKKFGVEIDVYNRKNSIPEICNKYDFIIVNEAWVPFIRNFVDDVRNCNPKIKIVLVPKEPFKNEFSRASHFEHKAWEHNGVKYLTPDLVCASGESVFNLWKDKCKVVITGYPRFDYYNKYVDKPEKSDMRKKYGIDLSKHIVFFASYPPYVYVEESNKLDSVPGIKFILPWRKGKLLDLYNAREETLAALEEFAKTHDDYQVVAKIHPQSLKTYKKPGTGTGKEVSGILKKYYQSPSSYMITLGEYWYSECAPKELLIASDIVVGWCSTMLLEGMLLGKKIIHTTFDVQKEINAYPEYKNVFSTASNKNELFNAIKDVKNIYDEGLQEYFLHKIDGKCCERICSAIKEVL